MRSFLLLACCLITFQGFSQKIVTNSDQQWIQYYQNLKLSPKWSILTDGGFRVKDAFSEKSQWIIRTGVGYQATANSRFGLGFANLGFFNGDTLTRLEYRPYQEAMLKHKFNRIGTSHRFRVEERFFQTLKPIGTTSFNFRFRYQFNLSLPIWTSKNNPNRKLIFNIADEIFINAGKDIVYNVFNQNRLILGPQFKVNKGLGIQFVYNYQFFARNAPATYSNDHVFWLRIKHTINVFKKGDSSKGGGGGKGDGSGKGDGTGGGRR